MKKTNATRMLALLLAGFAFGCEEDLPVTLVDQTKTQNFFNTGVCLNKDKATGPQEASPFTNMVWHDEFNGPREDEDPSCYTRTPTCASRQDWFGGEGPCPSNTNLAQLKQLNKCNWSIWSGYSFWGENQGTSFQNYHPNQLKIVNGELILTAKVNRDLKDLRCGYNPKSTWDKPDYQMLDCPITSGGLDSNPRAAPYAAGRNIRYGRVEVKASFQDRVGTFPAIWMWSAATGPDAAHPYLNQPEDFAKYPAAGEHDIFEMVIEKSGIMRALQTYHSWGNAKADNVLSSLGLPREVFIKPGVSYRFGVERKPEGIYFYIDDCYTQFISKDTPGRDGKPLYFNDLASFVMMNLTTVKQMMTIDNFTYNGDSTWTRVKPNPITGNFQQVDGAQMAIDYVRFFESPVPVKSGSALATSLKSATTSTKSSSRVILKSRAPAKLEKTKTQGFQLRQRTQPVR